MTSYKKILVTSDSNFSDTDLIISTINKISEEFNENQSSEELESEELESQSSEEMGECEISNNLIIFIRDRKQDNRIRNCLFSNNFRIIQFRAEYDKYPKDAGIKRNENIIQHKPEMIVIFLSENENENGLEHLQYLAFKNKIHLRIISKTSSYFDVYNYQNDVDFHEIPEIFCDIPKVNSQEYKDKMHKSTRMIRRMYYQNLNDKSSVKMISDDEIYKKNYTKKILSKAKRKRKLKKKNEENIKLESYD